MQCRGCHAVLEAPFLELGAMPPANSYVRPEAVDVPEPDFPLSVYVCPSCWLVQVPEMLPPEAIFSHYAYLSGFSEVWRAHCAEYARKMQQRLGLSTAHRVVEIASNDGTLLKAFQAHGVPVLGVEPAQNIAMQANAQGIPTKAAFFGKETASAMVAEGQRADLICANNVLAHVPDMQDFLAGFKLLLQPEGMITFEFPHLLEMLLHTQFDTIYHEHFFYLSLTALMPRFAEHGLQVVDVQTLPTHGGSLRVFVQHAGAGMPSAAIQEVLEAENAAKITHMETYTAFARRTAQVRVAVRQALAQFQQAGKRVAAYGAPAKGNTMLNYCGVTAEQVVYTVDRNPEKQGTLLPGSHIPVYAPEHLLQDQPDIVWILPWNIAGEVMQQMDVVRTWGGKFMTVMPDVRVW